MHHISVRRIEVLATVAETGSLSAAAARLGISQPSVSEHIAALERRLGKVLIERRRGHAAQLTAAGQEWLVQARPLLQHSRQLADAGASRPARPSRVVIATHPLLSAHVLSGVLAAFAQAHPDVELVVQTGSPETCLAGVREGATDVAYVLSNRALAGLGCRTVGWERYIFIAAPDHPLARREAIAPAELARHDFVRGPSGVMLSQEVEQIFHQLGIGAVKAASRTVDGTVSRNLVARGVGLHFTLEKSVRAELLAGTLVRLDVAAPATGIAVQEVSLPARVLSPSACLCRDYLQAHWPA